jgi:hypothetical protein
MKQNIRKKERKEKNDMIYGHFKLHLLIVSLIAILLSTAISQVRAQPIVDLEGHHNSGATDGLQLEGVSPTGGLFVYTVTVSAPVLIPSPTGFPTPAPLVLLRHVFPAPWVFNAYGSGPSNGTFDINSYDGAFARQAGGKTTYAYFPGGVEVDYPDPFSVTFDALPGGLELAAGHSLQWIQLLSTNWPKPGPDGTGPVNPGSVGGGVDPAGGNFPDGTVLPLPNVDVYVDPYSYNHAIANGPFYYTLAEQAKQTVLAGDNNYTSYTFTDAPARALAYASPGVPVVWSADLYLADWDGVNTVTLYEGVEWGFNITAVAVAGPPPQQGQGWTMGGVAGDKNDVMDAPMNVNATIVTANSTGVGGTVVPVDKLALLRVLLVQNAPYFGLALTAVIAVAVATAIYFKRAKRRQEKQ